MAVSLAALIVRDVGAEGLPRLMGALLVGSAMTAVLVGLRSSVPGTVSTVQDTPVVVIAAVAAPLVADVAPSEQVATLLVFVALSGLITGAVIWAIGAAGFGDVVRFLPASVLDGFRLGTGWLLMVGGLEVAAGSSLTTDVLEGVPGWAVALAVVVAVLLTVADRLGFAPSTLGLIILGLGAAFVLTAGAASSFDEVADKGWVLGPLDSDPRWRPLTTELGEADWAAILSQTPALFAVAFISITGLLLNVSAIEAEVERDAAIDRDLRATGVANLLGGAAGSSPAYIMFSGTMLAQRLGLRGRRASALIGVVILTVFVAGSSIAGFVPRFLAGGLLAGLGLQLAVGWLGRYWRAARGELVLSLLVAVVIGAVGVLEGVALGVLLAAIVFVRRYSLIDPVRRVTIGTTDLSRVDRASKAADHLSDCRDQVVVVELEGYLFFGSAARIGRAVRARVSETARHLILDLDAVSGIDGSAKTRLLQLKQRLESAGVTVWLCGAGAADLVADAPDDLDRTIAAVEDVLLGDRFASGQPLVDPLLDLLGDAPVREYQAGEDVFVPGDPSDGFVLLESGRLSVWLERSEANAVRVRQVGPGALLGELGYVTGEARSARATADDRSCVRVVDRAFIDAAGPVFASELNRLLLERVAARLTATNDLVRNLSR